MQNSRLEQENIGDISNLNQNLTELDLGYMKQIELERLIELARLDCRSELVLYCSQFNILPESLGNLTNLTWLSINSCQAIKLPTNIGNLTKLTCLNIKIDTSYCLQKSFFSFSRNLILQHFPVM